LINISNYHIAFVDKDYHTCQSSQIYIEGE